jgi:tetratricopeptide (TPR) repeat protein
MPTMINGIGTWYYGKRRIHRVKALCSQCNSLGELESYDTTLYFVVIMVPVIPLGQKRILEKCPYCQRHRMASLKEWEAGKANAFNDVLEKLQANPDHKETIQTALALATAYQDEIAFDKLADVLGGRQGNDADIQAQLGSAYEYFSRWSDAEAAYSRAMDVQPTDDISERLAVCLLKQNRPEEAIQYVSHVFEQKNPDKAWLSFWLIEGCMAKGLHEQSLDLMDVRDQAFPQFAKEKSYLKQRRTAEKYKHSGKPIPSTYLKESSKTGYKEGSGLGFKWPKYVAAALFLGLLALYLGSAWHRGQHREVYLANGWTKPYKVSVNGEVHQIQPGSVKKIEVVEGDVTVDWPESGDGPQTAAIHTSFFGRPFHRPVFVINPDRCALLEREETIYTLEPNPPMNPPPVFTTGKLLHEFEGVDHEFEQFPAQINAKSGSRTKKTRVGLVPMVDGADRRFTIASSVPIDAQMDYAKRLLHLDPNDVPALRWLTAQLPPADAIAFLKTRLADRPVRVDWHRDYQILMELANQDTDLKPEYRKLVEETKRTPDAVYLLGRLEEGQAGEKLYEEAAKANPPSAFACSGLGFRFLVRGDFEPAVTWSKKGAELNPTNPANRQAYLQALLAAGKYKDLIAETGRDASSGQLLMFHDKLAAQLALGDQAGVDMEIARMMANFGGQATDPAALNFKAQIRASLDLELALAQRDRGKYLELSARALAKDEFAVGILKGNHTAAANAPSFRAGGPREWETDATRTGLLYLAGLKAKDAAFADEQWKKFGNALGKGDRDARRLAEVAAGKQPLDSKWLTNATIRPDVKRVILAALARRFPAHAKDLVPLSKKLDFDHDSTSLCLRYVTE